MSPLCFFLYPSRHNLSPFVPFCVSLIPIIGCLPLYPSQNRLSPFGYPSRHKLPPFMYPSCHKLSPFPWCSTYPSNARVISTIITHTYNWFINLSIHIYYKIIIVKAKKHFIFKMFPDVLSYKKRNFVFGKDLVSLFIRVNLLLCTCSHSWSCNTHIINDLFIYLFWFILVFI